MDDSSQEPDNFLSLARYLALYLSRSFSLVALDSIGLLMSLLLLLLSSRYP